jgi:hypothetical protein
LAGVVTGTVGQFREFPVTSSKPESWTRESSQHFLHNVNATIDSSIEICQGARSLIVSWMGSMMVVTNPMVIKCSLLARSQDKTNGRHSTDNRNNGHIQMQFCAPFAAGAICKEK